MSARSSVWRSRVKRWTRAALGAVELELERKRPSGWQVARELLDRPERPTVLDIGANRGQTAHELRHFFPDCRLHCVEPDPQTFEILRHNVGDVEGVRLHNVALGHEDGEATLHRFGESAVNSLMSATPEAEVLTPRGWLTPAGTITVPLVRLETLCTDQGIPRIDLLKIDAQGFEGRILGGMGRYLSPERTRMIYLELNFVPLYVGQAEPLQLLETLREHGYLFWSLHGLESAPSGRLKWGNALCVDPALADAEVETSHD